MQLLHLPRPAHVVHQEVSVAFAPNESHNGCLLFGLGGSTSNNTVPLQLFRSVCRVHYTVNGTVVHFGGIVSNASLFMSHRKLARAPSCRRQSGSPETFSGFPAQAHIQKPDM